MELKTIESKNKIFTLLVEIKNFNDKNTFNLGKPDLFATDEQSNKNKKAISLLIQLIKEMSTSKEKEIRLSDSFELLFKIVENENDTGWVEKLTNVGSEGTDVLVKAMINIMLLNVFKEKASKKQQEEFRLHCMMDEIGKVLTVLFQLPVPVRKLVTSLWINWLFKHRDLWKTPVMRLMTYEQPVSL